MLLKHVDVRTDAFAVELLSGVSDGCVVLLVQGERMRSLTGDKVLALAAWKTPHSLALMIPQQERKSLLNLLTHHTQQPTDTAAEEDKGGEGAVDGSAGRGEGKEGPVEDAAMQTDGAAAVAMEGHADGV